MSTHAAPEPDSWEAVDRWRRSMRERLVEGRLRAGGERRRTWSRAIETHLPAVLPAPAGLVLGLYWPYKGEFDARRLAARLAGEGATLALPAVVQRRRPLAFRRWRPGDPTEPGAFGIPVPATHETVAPNALLVPVVGFDAACYRLGFGGGFYDITLASLDPRPLTVGVGYEIGRLETIHPWPHDVPLDVVVTEAGVQRRTRREEPKT